MHAQMSRPPGPPRSLMISVRPTPRKGAVSRPAFGAGAGRRWILVAVSFRACITANYSLWDNWGNLYLLRTRSGTPAALTEHTYFGT